MDTLNSSNRWLDSSTRAAAIAKLKAMQFVVAYEDWWLNDVALDEYYGVSKWEDSWPEKGVVKGEFIRSFTRWLANYNGKKLATFGGAFQEYVFFVLIPSARPLLLLITY